MKPHRWAVLVCSFVAAQAWPWGFDGHRIVGRIADQALNVKARSKVKSLLPEDTLEAAAVYPDWLRDLFRHQGPLVGKSEAAKFNKSHKDNREWHFTNPPLESGGYPGPDAFGARPNDAVQLVKSCVNVLRGESGASHKMTKRMALRWLAHLVGDLHQPMHSTSGYFEVLESGFPRLVTDPAEAEALVKAKKARSDSGGNAVPIVEHAADNLHSMWDNDLVKAAMKKSAPQPFADYKTFADHLFQDIRPLIAWQQAGVPDGWAEAWVAESLACARSGYAGLEYRVAIRNGSSWKYPAEVRPNYVDQEMSVARDRLVKAGMRLAAILNALWPE